tara:strand:+ start:145 stop:1824 length:1680 start_codon:yes stop_codon:yes gene_type:complete
MKFNEKKIAGKINDIFPSLCITYILFYYYQFYIKLGKNSFIRVHDFLDNIIPHIKTVVDNGLIILPSEKITTLFNGLQFGEISGAYSISLLWFSFFGTYWGIVFSKFLMTIVAFYGSEKLFKYIDNNKEITILRSLLSLCFATLPFWGVNMDLPGLPIVIYSIIKLRYKKNQGLYLLILAAYGFYSSLAFVGIFILFFIFSYYIYNIIFNKTYYKGILIGSIVLACSYSLSHISLIKTTLFSPEFTSMRTEFSSLHVEINNITKVFYNHVKSIFLSGHTHSPSFHIYFIPVILLFLHKSKTNKVLFLFVLSSSFLYSFKYVDCFNFGPLKFLLNLPLQLDRFYLFNGFFWYIMFFNSAKIICSYNRLFKFVFIASMLFQLRVVYYSSRSFTEKANNSPTFKEYYSESLFEEIKSHLDNNNYNFISVGFHPSISQYNNLKCLDGYVNNYSLNYKKEFLKVIKKEISKAKSIEDYFKNWGSRCYAFSTEISSNYKQLNLMKNLDLENLNLEYNYEKLKEMNCKYILSRYTISQPNHLKLLHKFIPKDKSQFNQIYLYEMSI